MYPPACRDPKKAGPQALAYLTSNLQGFQDALEAPDWLTWVPLLLLGGVLLRMAGRAGCGVACVVRLRCGSVTGGRWNSQSGMCLSALFRMQPHAQLHHAHRWALLAGLLPDHR